MLPSPQRHHQNNIDLHKRNMKQSSFFLTISWMTSYAQYWIRVPYQIDERISLNILPWGDQCKPHKPVCSSTIARWLKTFLGKPGTIWTFSRPTLYKVQAHLQQLLPLMISWRVAKQCSIVNQPQIASWQGSTFIRIATTKILTTNTRWHGDWASWSIITEWLSPRT